MFIELTVSEHWLSTSGVPSTGVVAENTELLPLVVHILWKWRVASRRHEEVNTIMSGRATRNQNQVKQAQ